MDLAVGLQDINKNTRLLPTEDKLLNLDSVSIFLGNFYTSVNLGLNPLNPVNTLCIYLSTSR